MSHPHEALIHSFYEAFAERDAETMAAAYADDAVFTDPAFPRLVGEEIGDMWRMLCERGEDLRIEHSDVQADDTSGRAHWEAHYTFSVTGRKVHNIIDAAFELRDGTIIRHIDTFSFWRWSRQALGPAGLFLGWTPIVRNKVQSQAAKGLAAYRAKRAG